MTDFGTLRIDDVILHRVPKGVRDPDGPDTIDYSEAPIELGVGDRDFLQLRLRETLGGRARPVIEMDDNDDDTPEVIRQLVGGAGQLVDQSAELARRLHGRQKWMSSVGLLLVITGQVDSESCLIIAKMEHEEGMRVQDALTADGKRTYKAEYLKDLILGQGTKVFKVGVFKASGARSGKKLTGEVVDVQQGGGHVAAYFVEFLGCQFVQRPEVLTENFFNASQSFINRTAKGDPEAGAAYEIALLSEMQAATATINAEQFAHHHLREEHRDDFMAHLTKEGVVLRGFNKDVSLVTGQIKRVKIQTERGATVLVPPAMYEDGAVSVSNADDETEKVIVVRDAITSIGGAGGGPKHGEDAPRADEG